MTDRFAAFDAYVGLAPIARAWTWIGLPTTNAMFMSEPPTPATTQ